MAGKKDQGSSSAALATVEEKKPAAALALAQSDELASVLGDEDLGVTGLEEVDSSDIRLASLIWNFQGLGPDGRQRPKDVFFNTIDESSSEKKRVALLVLHKSRSYAEFVDGSTKRRCTSWDGVTGRVGEGLAGFEPGQERPCAGCPDYEWRTVNGKRGRKCTDVHNVVAVDRETNQPVMLRFKSTSLAPWKNHLNKHFLGRRVVNGKRGNYPLFAFETLLSLKLEKNGNNAYAVPQLERGEVLSAEEIRSHAESAKVFREVYLDREVKAEAEREHGDADPGAGDTSFDVDKFADTDKGGSAAATAANPRNFE